MTIKEAEAQVEEKISEAFKELKELNVLPAGYRCRAHIRGQSRKKRQSASFETSWSPDSDSIEITFERNPERSQAQLQPMPGIPAVAPLNSSSKPGSVSEPLSDLIKALDRAQSLPGFRFVALKWFRDTVLPSEGFSWFSADTVRNVLRDAIERRIILTRKEPNPRSPQFPVTAIWLNQTMPEVQATLGCRDKPPSDFQPVPIRGENLSATVLRERR